MVTMLDIDPLSIEGMVILFVILSVTYLLIVSGGWTLIIGALLVLVVAFILYVVLYRFFRWSVGAGGGA